MSVVNRNSNIITNAVAIPNTPNNPAVGAPAMLKEAAGYVTNAADDDATSVHRFCRVPSNARISQILLSTGDATTAGNIDIGVYQTSEYGGAVVDADLFTSALALTGGPFQNVDVTYESGQYTEAESIMPLWQVIGLSADPCRDYDIAATITTTYQAAAVGQLLKVRYVG